MNLDFPDRIGIDRTLKRGSGEIIENSGSTLFAFDNISGAYFLICESVEDGLAALERHKARKYRLLMVSGPAFAGAAFEKYALTEKLECYQFAYLGKPPAVNTELCFKIADRRDIPTVAEAYRLISAKELEKVAERGSLMLAYDGGRLVGFIGEHLEGSMGMLYVFPQYRRRGYAAALEKRYIAGTMEKGFVPFGQVEKNNVASLELQKKIGMTQAGNMIFWMWK